MHIKQIIIQGFKSYKEQTVIEPFSPGTNVIVGRNGSGKSNFFAAIRFVLSDAYTNMSREERQALLHEGSGSAVLSAYVEIIFDNTDKRFSEPGDEVVIRRTIGLKKDEYSVDKKVQTRSDVLKILETAGFAKENPFYIVPQGRIAAITNMKESERLNLLKEIAGTNTYDDRRVQSLKIMAETNSKREKIDELLVYINERLTELEEEKNELRDFQDKDKERRCLEYAHWHRLQETNAEALQQIEDARQSGATTKDRAQLQQTEKEIAALEHKYQSVQQSLQLLAVERRQLDEDRKETARTRAKAEVMLKELDGARHSRDQQHKQHETALRNIRQGIEAAERELAKLNPEYSKWMAQETEIKTERDAAAAGRRRLLTKQTRSAQFPTKAARDNYLNQEINDITSKLGAQRANEMDAKEQVKSIEENIAQLEKDIHDTRQKVASYGEDRESLAKRLLEAEDKEARLQNERKQLRREEDKLRSLTDNALRERQNAEKDLSHSMDAATSRGLASIKRLKQEKNIPGAYGTLAELMTVPIEGYRLPVEQVAGNSLFHYVVDNERTGTMLSDHLYKTHGGRLTFMPLEQLRPRQVKMPRASDAQPLISKIEYDPKYEKAFQQVFGRTIVCPNLSVASQYSRSHGLDAITPEGDTTNKRGAMTGGYVDSRRSRLEAVRRVEELRETCDKHLADIREVRNQIQVMDQQVTAADGERQKIEQEMRRFEQGLDPLKTTLQSKNAQLERERVNLEAAKRRRAEVEANIRELDASLEAARAELQTEFKKALSASEESQLAEFTSELHRLQTQLKEVSKKRMELEHRKVTLETQLSASLREQDQLQSQALENSLTGGSGSYEDAKKELKKAQRAAAEVDRLLQENEAKKEQVATQLAELEAQKTQKESEQQDLQKRVEQHQKRMEKNIQMKARLVSQAAEYAKNIRDLGMLPEEAFGKYERMKSEQIENRLRKVNEALKKYIHVNKKAFDQYTNFTNQRDQLLKRRKELDDSQKSIEELIEHLDQAKDEAIERTFKQVSKEFSAIFEQLVPAGHGRLVIQRKADRAKNARHAGDSEDEATAVENYTGVGISVSFNSKVLDEQQKIQQLSGGQKSLCALCLIFALQAAESSPFVIFDEVDANLDAQYRTAVASLLDHISKTQKTQFICTTFRPEIVHVADKCYGVTFHNKTSTIDCVPTAEALNFVEGQRK
ncbi:chromosome segregation protein sudA [Echria macrotheca]|uniref:Structural maintenance of chromosomes protein n=1 Tax=Echria macrotheca TaxID=438768 RepID=A0AAJ0BDV2_9PEZI|nr:chromosome segregation protein sudA [Echria macrotheca]